MSNLEQGAITGGVAYRRKREKMAYNCETRIRQLEASVKAAEARAAELTAIQDWITINMHEYSDGGLSDIEIIQDVYKRLHQTIDVNAELQAEIERLTADVSHYQSVYEELRKVLLMVEYMTTGDNDPLYCPWCGTVDYNGHAPDCPRQKALGL